MFLAPLPVGRLYGVENKTEKVLLERGVKTIGDLANYPFDELVSAFGRTLGLYFQEAARGIERALLDQAEEIIEHFHAFFDVILYGNVRVITI